MSLVRDDTGSSDSMDVASTDSGASPFSPTKPDGSQEKLQCLEATLGVHRYENRDSLAHDLSFLAAMPDLCDVTFLVGKDRQPVCAVRAILAARSRVFRRMLYGDGSLGGRKKKKQQYKPSDGYIERYDFRGQPTVIVKDFEADVFKQMVEYTHTGGVMLQARSLLGLMNAADHYKLEELKLACIQFMEHCINIDTVCSLLSSAEKYIQYKSTKILVQKMFEFVDQYAESILALGVFSTLPQHVVRIVLGREELHATEITKFEAALRWCVRYCEEHPNLSLKEAFEPFVGVIDFCQISARHLMKNVKPADVVSDAIILAALAYQADPSSVEHVKVHVPQRYRKSPIPHEPSKYSPKFRRVQSGQPLSHEAKVILPTDDSRRIRSESVPPLDRVDSAEKLLPREAVHPARLHSTSRDSFSSVISSSPKSPSSYHGSMSSLETNTDSEVKENGTNSPRKVSYTALDTIVTLSSNKAIEV